MDKQSDNSPKDLLDGLLTSQDVKTVIERATGKTTEIVTYDVKPYSEVRVGFLGSHSYLNVTYKHNGSSKNESLSFFLKSIPKNSEAEEKIIRESGVFVKETTFFKQIIPELTKNYQSEAWCPTCYLVKDEMLILENLKLQEFKMLEEVQDTVSLQSVLTSLARFHAMTIVAEKRRGKTFYETHPLLFEEFVFNRAGLINNWQNNRIDLIMTLARPYVCDTNKLKKYIDDFFKKLRPSHTRRNVITHGDIWPNNYMLDNSSPPRCRLVDYQALRYLPVSADVAQAIYLSTGRAFRDASENNLINHYHQVLCETLQLHDDEILLPKLEDIRQEYEEYRFFGLMVAAFYYPGTLLSNEVRTELTNDPEAYKNFIEENKVEIVLEFMEKYADYRERITEVIVEIVEQSKALE